MSPQLNREISEIGVPGYENDDIGSHLDRKLECVDRHHHVYVRLVMTFFGGRPIFGHDHESIGAQPMHELVLLIPLLLPDWNGGRKTGINHHLDQVASCAWAGQEIAELQPIETAPGRPHRAADIRFIYEHKHSRTRATFGISFSD